HPVVERLRIRQQGDDQERVVVDVQLHARQRGLRRRSHLHRRRERWRTHERTPPVRASRRLSRVITMTVPKWLVPALAIVAALAVGVAATLLGRALTTPDAVEVPSGTVVVPVLAPVPEQSHPSDEPAGETAEAPVSETVAERQITLPASDPEVIDPALAALIDALAEAADPVFTLMERDA